MSAAGPKPDGKPSRLRLATTKQNPAPSALDAPAIDWPELEALVRERTPARLLLGRAGAAYTTATQIRLRHDHAAARDAVMREFDARRDFEAQFATRHDLFFISTKARSKAEYLMRPDLGREFSQEAEQMLLRAPQGTDLQVALGDGLSVTAMLKQAPPLLDLLMAGAKKLDWKLGRPFVIQHCRVGVLNSIGGLLRPKVAVLLIGERPGLATAESLSAYMAFHPNASHTDADCNLISNIHERGVPLEQAAARILNLAAQMMQREMSGARLKEMFVNQPLSEQKPSE